MLSKTKLHEKNIIKNNETQLEEEEKIKGEEEKIVNVNLIIIYFKGDKCENT